MEADEEGNESDLQDAMRAAVEEVARIDRGDMLDLHAHRTRHPRDGQNAPRPAAAGRRPRRRHRNPAAVRTAFDAGTATGLPSRPQTAGGHRHERGRVVAHRAANSLRDRPRHGSDQPLLAAVQDAAVADRGRLAGLGRPAQGPLRARGAGRVRAAVQRGGLSRPRPLHHAGNPTDESGRGDFADEGPAAGRAGGFPAHRSAEVRSGEGRLSHALRARRDGQRTRADGDRPTAGPTAGRSADRADDPGGPRRGLPAGSAGHRRRRWRCKTPASAHWKSRRRPTPPMRGSWTSSPTS